MNPVNFESRMSSLLSVQDFQAHVLSSGWPKEEHLSNISHLVLLINHRERLPADLYNDFVQSPFERFIDTQGDVTSKLQAVEAACAAVHDNNVYETVNDVYRLYIRLLWHLYETDDEYRRLFNHSN